MSALTVILSVIDIILGIALVVLFMVQEGNDQGMGIIGGTSNDSYYSKAKGRTLEERLKRYTFFVAIAFAITSVVLYLVISRGL